MPRPTAAGSGGLLTGSGGYVTGSGGHAAGSGGSADWDAGASNSVAADEVGLIFGTVTPPAPATATNNSAGLVPQAASLDSDANVISGRLIVSFRAGESPDPSRLHQWQAASAYRFSLRSYVGPDTMVVDVRDTRRAAQSMTRDQTRAVAQLMMSHPSLRTAEPDRILRRFQLPNDPRLPAMWHLRQANIPSAWDLGTGAPTTVVAVIDNGVKPHPDLPTLLPGYDFISDANNAADGDGRDPDPSPESFVDPTDGGVSWHGEHVAGTIAASAGNQSGIAGIDWQCKILPVRVIGRDGATASDVLAALYWAAGFTVPGVPVNPTPAHVINLSLGADGKSATEQHALSEIAARGVVIVAAAGNSNADVSNWSYAGYSDVIAVGALDRMGRRAEYSNYGPNISIMAPGGDMTADADGDGDPDGVLSLWFSDDGTTPGLAFLYGTSMAAPHVTGVVSLMRAVNPSLTPAQILQILKDTAVPSGQCTVTIDGRQVDGCGAGAMNAAAALLRAKATTDSSAQAPTLELGSDRLHVTAEGAKLAILNAGGGALSWSISASGPNASALRVSPSSGSVAARQGAAVSFSVTPGALPVGAYASYVRVVSNAGERVLPVSFIVGTPQLQDVGYAYQLVYDGKAGGEVAGSSFTRLELGYTFFIRTIPGTWYLTSWVDVNDDYDVDLGDLWGVYPSVSRAQTISVADSDLLGPHSISLVPYAP